MKANDFIEKMKNWGEEIGKGKVLEKCSKKESRIIQKGGGQHD